MQFGLNSQFPLKNSRMDDFRIEYDAPNAVYFPGQAVTGKVIIQNREWIKARFLKICIHGGAHTGWSDSERRSRTWVGLELLEKMEQKIGLWAFFFSISSDFSSISKFFPTSVSHSQNSPIFTEKKTKKVVKSNAYYVNTEAGLLSSLMRFEISYKMPLNPSQKLHFEGSYALLNLEMREWETAEKQTVVFSAVSRSLTTNPSKALNSCFKIWAFRLVSWLLNKESHKLSVDMQFADKIFFWISGFRQKMSSFIWQMHFEILHKMLQKPAKHSILKRVTRF